MLLDKEVMLFVLEEEEEVVVVSLTLPVPGVAPRLTNRDVGTKRVISAILLRGTGLASIVLPAGCSLIVAAANVEDGDDDGG